MGSIHTLHTEEVGRKALPVLVDNGVASDTRAVSRVCDGDSLGMLVLGMMLLGMDLLMLLQVLRPFKRLLTDYANVRFEWSMD